MKEKLKFCVFTTASILALMGLGAVTGAVGSGAASTGMPYRDPESVRK